MPPAGPASWPGRLAAAPVIELFPGWVLGSGQAANLITRLRKGIWRLLRSPFEVEWLEGLRVVLYPGNEICRSIFVTGRYEPNEFLWLERVLKPGMTFVDVGANLGLYALFASRRVSETGRVIAIEPSRREMDRLRTNIERNSLRNVSLLPVALSDQAAEVDLSVAVASHAGHNTLGSFGYNTQLERRETVQALSLDEVIESAKLQRVDVIKMDIEGSELAALRGASGTLTQYHPTLLMELSDRALKHQGATSADVRSLLADHGYEVSVFDSSSGLPLPLTPKNYFDSENVIAVPRGAKAW
ncbi:MAG TPA: FkbM family methyltransferase [Terriglobales bacterium]|nr:FkbM family methyltransferase [Terriglobales bacterium]